MQSHPRHRVAPTVPSFRRVARFGVLLVTLAASSVGCDACSKSDDDARSDGGRGNGTDAGKGPDASSGGADAGNTDECEATGLVWHSGRKTNYTSYPEPGSDECEEFNGCLWEGLFAGCNGKQTEAWVQAHDIAAVFPGYGALEHHRLCLRSGTRVMIVHVLDTCADSDCSGCCTTNQGSADALIDLESYTNERWGLSDGPLEWADLGEAPSPCE